MFIFHWCESHPLIGGLCSGSIAVYSCILLTRAVFDDQCNYLRGLAALMFFLVMQITLVAIVLDNQNYSIKQLATAGNPEGVKYARTNK